MRAPRVKPLRLIVALATALPLLARAPTARADECAKVSVVFARQVKALEKLAGMASAASLSCAFAAGPNDARFAAVRRAAIKTYRAFLKDIAVLDTVARCVRRDPASLMHDTSKVAGDRIARAWAVCTTEAEQAFVTLPDDAARATYGAEHGRAVIYAILRDAGFPDDLLSDTP